MCGIVGFSGRDPELIGRMMESITHRGPDSGGMKENVEFTFGMRRLSIIDVAGGEQPLVSPESGVSIVFNGEIYNHPELRAELSGRGHRFFTDHSDTETILRAYEEWGDQCVEHLTGMFAFAVYDPSRHELFLARDRLGIKPLYYYANGPKFVFGSEFKALFQDAEVPRRPNEQVLLGFLMHRVHDSTEETFYEGVSRLLPGHWMAVGPEGVRRIKQYWSPAISPEFSSSKSDAEYAEEFYELFSKVVKRHMISDVPVGVTLSGGLDSSGIASIMREQMDRGADTHTAGTLYTFSALFPGQTIDESDYIHEVERAVGSIPHYAYPTVDKFWDEMGEWIWYQEEPTISSAPYAYYSVYKIAHEHVKVVLSGNGGDELLAGYIPYFRAYLTSALDQRKLLAAGRELWAGRDLYNGFIKAALRSGNTRGQGGMSMRSLLAVGDDQLRSVDFRPDRNLNRRLGQDILKFSTPNLLRYEDKNSMAFSIESRVPFLDHELVEYVLALPIDQKIKKGWNRFVYRNAMKGHMPELNRTRRSKIGFTNPEVDWIRMKAPVIRDIFASHELSARGIYDQTKLCESFDAWVAGAEGEGLTFWRVLVSELWMRKFVDSPVGLVS